MTPGLGIPQEELMGFAREKDVWVLKQVDGCSLLLQNLPKNHQICAFILQYQMNAVSAVCTSIGALQRRTTNS